MSIYMPNCYICLLQTVSLVSVYVSSIVQSFIWAYYRPAYMPNVHYAKSYVFAYVSCCIYYSTRISMPVNISSSVSTYMPSALSHMLHVICRLSYAKARMPVFVCQMPCASYCKFTVKSAYMPISVPVSACYIICWHMSAKYLL
jgi:hypothetical protein